MMKRRTRQLKWALIWTWEAWDRRYDEYVRKIAWQKWKRLFSPRRAR